MSSLTADHYFWCSGGVPCCFEGVPGYYGMFWGVLGLFQAVPGYSGGVPGVFRGVPGCSGFYRRPNLSIFFPIFAIPSPKPIL